MPLCDQASGGGEAITGVIRAPLVGRCFSVGTGRPSTVLLFHMNSFCRVCNRSTIAKTRVLNVMRAGGTGKPKRAVRVTNFPRRTLSDCLPGLIHTNGHMTVYSRLRSPGLAGGLIGHNVARLMAPNISVGSGVLGRGRGGFLTTVRFNGSIYKVTFLSVSANRFLATRKAISCISGLLGGFSPGRMLIRQNDHGHFRRTFNPQFFVFRLSS